MTLICTCTNFIFSKTMIQSTHPRLLRHGLKKMMLISFHGHQIAQISALLRTCGITLNVEYVHATLFHGQKKIYGLHFRRSGIRLKLRLLIACMNLCHRESRIFMRLMVVILNTSFKRIHVIFLSKSNIQVEQLNIMDAFLGNLIKHMALLI